MRHKIRGQHKVLIHIGVRLRFFVNFVETTPLYLSDMSEASFFKTFLSELDQTDSKGLSEVLDKLNSHASVRKVPLFGTPVDVAYVGEDHSFLLVKFDFFDASKGGQSWLADEESCGLEPPLYFSQSDPRVSPVYEMQRVKCALALLLPDAEIEMLLVCNYSIVNYEMMEEAWEEIGVTVIHEIDETISDVFRPSDDDKRLLVKAAAVASIQTEESDLDKAFPELMKKVFNSKKQHEFSENNLDLDSDAGTDSDSDFPFSDLSGSETKGAENQENENTINKTDNNSELKIKSIRLFRGPLDSDKGIPQESLWAFDVRRLESVCLAFEASSRLSRCHYGEMSVNLYDETGQLLVHKEVFPSVIHTEYITDLFLFCSFDKDESFRWAQGNYVIELKYRDRMVAPVTFQVGKRNVHGYYKSESSMDTHMPEQPFEVLKSLIGLSQVKEKMATYRDMVRMAIQRRQNGLSVPPFSLHTAFMGNPGTGKTTVARLYGAMLKELGLLSSGHVVYKERSLLTGQNYSSEQELTLQAIQEAQGGVLFIDEAHNLYNPNDPRDPGKNVIQTLLTALSDEQKNDWALLLAGYPDGITRLFSVDQGFPSRIPEQNRYYFQDYTADELMQIADSYCIRHNYFISEKAREALRMKVRHDYRLRDEKFGNARYVTTLLTSEILSAMASRLARRSPVSLFDMLTIEREDIPSPHVKDYKGSMRKLYDMVGLGALKKSIEAHLNMVKLMMLRNEQGIETAMPPLHMVFTGNPGTGKTTVASFIGEIYASMGLLSKGDLIYVERKDLVGQFVGDTEKNTEDVLNRAKGNVLFIDEAYTLAPKGNEKDFGPRALEVLLSALDKESVDMLVIMAGYKEEMLASNRGLRSRIPYTFHFVDYTADELMQIADQVAERSHFRFSSAARRKLRELVEFKLAGKDVNWGNARFITRLISSQILPAMSSRLAALPAAKQKDRNRLCLICQEDIPSPGDDAVREQKVGFDEEAVGRALKRLDALVGLEEVKRSIHDFVDVSRYMLSQGGGWMDNEPLRWNFTGNTGTGKSTVAGIMAELLRAMNLLGKGHLVELKAETLYNVSDFKAEELLQKAMKRSEQGLLFIDGDAPVFKYPDSRFNSEVLRFKLSSMTMELPGTYALVIAENEGTPHLLTRSLREGGITSFDHTLHFADYTEEELLAILGKCLQRKRLRLSPEAARHMADYIHSLCANRRLGYANARTMSKLARSIAETALLRISTGDPHDDSMVRLCDVEHYVWKEVNTRRIGYVKP